MSLLRDFNKTCLAIAISQSLAMLVYADSIEVDSATDPGADDAECSLREAIVTANTDTDTGGCTRVSAAGKDQINFNTNLTGQTIVLTSVLPYISQDLAINGLGKDQLTISGNNAVRIMRITGSNVDLNDLKLRDGSSGWGGAFHADNATVSLKDSEVTGNTASSDHGGGFSAYTSTISLSNSTVSSNVATKDGGAIRIHSSNLHLDGSTITGNTAGEDGGGIYARTSSLVELTNNSTVSSNQSNGGTGGGGLVIISSQLTINNSTVSDNQAANSSAGFDLFSSQATVTDSIISGNTATYHAGGFNISHTSSVTLTNTEVSGNSAGWNAGGLRAKNGSTLNLERSTVSGNNARRGGGMIVDSTGTTVTLKNSTLSGNTATEAQFGGGGVLLVDYGSLELVHSTVTDNSSLGDGGGIRIYGDSPTVNLVNSLLSGNTATLSGDEFYSAVSTAGLAGVNLLADSSKTRSESFTGLTPRAQDIDASSDYGNIALSAIIDSTLSDNGGKTLTHALVKNSPAIDAADNSLCLSVDQRGKARGAKCDIGSYEFIQDETCYVIKGKGPPTVVFCF